MGFVTICFSIGSQTRGMVAHVGVVLRHPRQGDMLLEVRYFSQFLQTNIRGGFGTDKLVREVFKNIIFDFGMNASKVSLVLGLAELHVSTWHLN